VASFQAHHDHFTEAPALLGLARERPVFVELDTRVDPELYPLLNLRGIYAQVGARASARQIEPELQAFYVFQHARLGEQAHEPETSRQLLWTHYMNAIQLGSLGHVALAREALAQALALQPTERRLEALQQALSAKAPLDASAFLRF
jgi:hypothetical protein